jgi:precorrin-6B C5,15-methyltransferase / cobalt-precorrin-6B C5,C15-methyltransferase
MPSPANAPWLAATNAPWLAIVGIGEDGVEGMSGAAQVLVRQATLVMGGARHLNLAMSLIRGEARAWPSPMSDGLSQILTRRGQPTAVLASGDPFCFGVGGTLAKLLDAAEFVCLPAPSAFALACARLGWAARDTAQVSLCGRPIARLAPLLQPGRRLLVLSADETTPAVLATWLVGRGFGPSRLHVLEALGGPRERRRITTAAEFGLEAIDPLNLVAVELRAGPGARIIPLACGLPDDAFEHDGQITKREIRAVTLSALAPGAGELLWDVGGGSGTISIEWMLRHPDNGAVMLEPNGERAARAGRNACHLGVPGLQILPARAPAGLAGLPTPDAVFLGGGASDPAVIDAAWSALRPGGRLVANAVTVETEAAIVHARARFGGSLTRLSVERLAKIGRVEGFRPARTVTQWAAVKP